MTKLLMSMRQDSSACPSSPSHRDHLGALAQWVLNSDASAFYEEAGEAAAALGLTVDIFALSPCTCGLNVIEALASGSGGCIRLYPSPQHAAMPQDTGSFSCSIILGRRCSGLRGLPADPHSR